MPAASSYLAVAGLIGGGISAYGSYKAGEESKEQADYNAITAETERTHIEAVGELNEFRRRKQLATATGEQIAKYAKSGVKFTGSPLDVIADSIANAELEIAIGKFNIKTEAERKSQEAAELRRYGRVQQRAGQYQAASTLLSTAATASNNKIGGTTKPKYEMIGSHRGVRTS